MSDYPNYSGNNNQYPTFNNDNYPPNNGNQYAPPDEYQAQQQNTNYGFDYYTPQQNVNQQSLGDDYPPPRNTSDSIVKQPKNKPYKPYKPYGTSRFEGGVKCFKSTCGGKRHTIETCWVLSLAIGTFVYMIIYLVKYYKSDYSLGDIGGALSYITYNVGHGPVMNVSIKSGSCPNGSTTTNVGYWDGTVNGCICSRSDITTGYCSEYDYGCYNVSSTSSHNLNDWQKREFCYFRAVENQDFVYNTTCSDSKYVQCSPGLCFKKSVGCPVSNAYISNGKVDDKSLPLFGNKYLNLQNESGSFPLSQFSAQLSKTPCFDNNKKYVGSGSYPLMQRVSCGSYGYDSTYTYPIDNYTLLHWLSDNRIDVNLDYFNDYADEDTAYFSARNKFWVNASSDDCVSLDLNSINDASGHLNTMDGGIIYTGWVAAVFSFFMVITAIAFSCIKDYDTGAKAKYIIHLVPSALFFICTLIIFWIVKVTGNELNESTSVFETVQDEKCFNGTSMDVFDDYQKAGSTYIPMLETMANTVFVLGIMSLVSVILFRVCSP